jgi:signal transduction histidine kinase
VQLHVCDAGSGIPAAQLPHLFEPLYTTKAAGTGLGLYIVREIMTAHAGQSTVQRVAGQGTPLTLLLPLAGEEGVREGDCTSSADGGGDDTARSYEDAQPRR